MAQVSIRITDNILLGRKKIGRAVEDLSDKYAWSLMMQAAKEARGGWPGGPIDGYTVRKPPGSKYRRTGNLGASTNLVKSGRTYTVKSNAVSDTGKPYSVKVLGDGAGRNQVFTWWPNEPRPATPTNTRRAT